MPARIVSFILFSVLVACNNKKELPDVSGITVKAPVDRFDQDLFLIDTGNIRAGLDRLYNKYPVMTPIFLQNVLGLESENTLMGAKQFIQQTLPVRDTLNIIFPDMNAVQQGFISAYKYIKYYFPGFKEPRIVTIVGPINALAQTSTGYTTCFLTEDFLGVSLQFYLGKNYSAYQDPYFIEQVAPAYRSRRFSKEYLVADGVQLIVDDLFPDQSKGKPLVEQMIERGKQWWLLDQFMPEAPDSVKTGYTQQQLDWCNQNEGLIWGYIVKNEELYSVNPITIQTYIGEGPFTQGFSQELSPGNIGPWIGRQIVREYAKNNPALTPEVIMKTIPKKILEEARYRPD